jgi:ERCC4-type nuclease
MIDSIVNVSPKRPLTATQRLELLESVVLNMLMDFSYMSEDEAREVLQDPEKTIDAAAIERLMTEPKFDPKEADEIYRKLQGMPDA